MNKTSYSSAKGSIKPSPDIIKIRIRNWVEKRYVGNFSSLNPELRRAVVWCLHDRFQFSNVNIASTISASKRTIIRDIQAAELYMKVSKRFQTRVDEMENYILYNTKQIYWFSSH